MNNSKSLLSSQYPLVSVNLVVYNGEKYIRHCLDSVLAQTYKNIEINILDNCSTDSTVKIISSEYYDSMIYHSDLANGLKLRLIKSKKNWGTWPGQEELLKYSRGKYIVALSVDIILNENFITEAVKVFEKDEKIGAIQGKIYKYELSQLQTTNYQLPTNVIDTCGFEIFRSRRIVNIGHGEEDRGQYNQEKEIFAVEGAVPVLRREALDDCRLESQTSKKIGKSEFPLYHDRDKVGTLIKVPANKDAVEERGGIVEEGGVFNNGLIIDPDFFWYGDDLDLAWRMRLFGWKQVFAPKVVAWHDRQTTKALAGGGWREFIKIRKTVPMFKRRLDWRNTTLAIIKNDFASNLLCDSYYILWRQLRLWVYFILFEPAMILEKFRVVKMLPKMLKRRGEIMRKAKISAREMQKWFA